MKNNSEIKKPIVIGHRGAKFHALENTVDSIKKAIVLKADMVEVDVRLTKDNVPVLMHDMRINRTTDGKGRVSKLTLKEIKRFNTDGEKVPTLEHVLRNFKNIKFNLHMKEYKAMLPALKLIYKHKAEDRIMVSSFSLGVLRLLKEFNPQIESALICIVPRKSSLRLAKRLKLNAVNPHYFFVTKRFIERAHRLGIEVNPWTVNNLHKIEKLIENDADGIITDDPSLIKKRSRRKIY